MIVRLTLPMLLVLLVAVPGLAGDKAPAAWTQWGGTNRDFKSGAGELKTSWPEGGPEELWSRELGDGYSAILADGGRLYTMYRTNGQEVVICLDAATGKTVWEFAYEQPMRKRHIPGWGDGPRSTPLISDGLLFTVGITGKMHALRKSDGKVLWSREMWGDEFPNSFQGLGYSSSPLAYKDTVILPIGGENAGLVALDRQTGQVKWRALDFKNSYSSPNIMEVAGEQQLVVFMAEELIGVNPDTGDLRWRYPHTNQWQQNINMPVIVGGDTMFLSSSQAGSRGIRLTRNDKKFEVEEIWSSRRVQFYHVTSVQDGDWVYGSTGAMSPAFMTAINIRTGKVGWRRRGIAKANCVDAGGKLVILDEDGMLYLASATPESLVVHAKTQLLENVAWTVPTVVGKTLYARDLKRIVAVKLG